MRVSGWGRGSGIHSSLKKTLFTRIKHFTYSFERIKKNCYILKLYFGLIFGLFSIYSLIRIHYSVFIIFSTIHEK